MTTTTGAKRRGNSEGSNPTLRADGRWQTHIRTTDEYGVSKRTTCYGRTAKEARDAAAAIRRRVADGQPTSDRKQTLGAFTAEWITSTLAASDRKQTTMVLYGGLARSHIIGSRLGNLSLDKLRPMHVEAWIVDLRGIGLSESSIRSIYTVARAVLDTAVRDGALGRNPAAAVKRPKVTATEAAHMQPEQVRQLLDSAQQSRYALMFELLVNTGLRRGEALALQWSDVDTANGTLRVRGTIARVGGVLVVTEPKTAKSKRFIHMSANVERILRLARIAQMADRLRAGSQWVETGFVFTTQAGQPCDPRNALRAFKSASGKAGITGVSLHTLRHSAATMMLTNAVPLKVVSEILGHSSIAITGDVYGHVSPDVSRDALTSLSAALNA